MEPTYLSSRKVKVHAKSWKLQQVSLQLWWPALQPKLQIEVHLFPGLQGNLSYPVQSSEPIVSTVTPRTIHRDLEPSSSLGGSAIVYLDRVTLGRHLPRHCFSSILSTSVCPFKTITGHSLPSSSSPRRSRR